MIRKIPFIAAVMLGAFTLVSAQIPNVKFTDMKGKSWDLYTIIGEGDG
jgi:hypothetical protein